VGCIFNSVWLIITREIPCMYIFRKVQIIEIKTIEQLLPRPLNSYYQIIYTYYYLLGIYLYPNKGIHYNEGFFCLQPTLTIFFTHISFNLETFIAAIQVKQHCTFCKDGLFKKSLQPETQKFNLRKLKLK
jgi:hypothetical protein